MRKNILVICLLVLALIITIPAVIMANDSASDTGNIPEYGGNIYNAGNLNISGGRIFGGIARYGGNIFNHKTGSLSVSGKSMILNGVAEVLGNNVYTANGAIFNPGGFIGQLGANDDGIFIQGHSTCICGSSTGKHVGDCDGEYMSIVWQEWTKSDSLPAESGYFYLTDDVSVTDLVTVVGGHNIYIDLNGKTISRSSGDRIYNLNSSTSNSLTILDSVGTGRIELGDATATGAFVSLDNANTFTMYGGTINGAAANYDHVEKPGAIVRVIGADSVVNIHGGTIIGGKATFGGGAIGMSGGTLNMTAGEIKNGTANRGGNIYVVNGATVNLSGAAAITGGTATDSSCSGSDNMYVEQGAVLNIADDVDTIENIFKAGTVLKVGYGIGDITPTEALEMNGGWYTGYLDDMKVITVAFEDEEGNLYIHVVTDLSAAGISPNGPENSLGVCDMIRVAAEAQLGFSPDYITVGGTHNHSQVKYSSSNEANALWRENVLIPQAIASIQQAIDDLAPAEMYIGRTETENLTFVRRYWLSDGTLYEGFTGNRDSETVAHESDADEEVQLVKFAREGKEDVVMVNWQTHATVVSSYGTQASSDFVGTLRNKVEDELGVKCVFYQGACGNLAHNSRLESDNPVVPGTGWAAAQKVGNAVAGYVIDAFKSGEFVKVNTGVIQMKRIKVIGDVMKYSDEMYQNALKVVEYSKTAEDNYDTAAYAAQFGIETIHHAEAIIDCNNAGSKKAYELNIISVGDVAFITLPMEFFDTTGMQIKNGSPYKMTVLLGYTCSVGRYVPNIEACENGGYETYNTYFVHGTAEIARDHYLDALKELHKIRFMNW